MNSQFTHFVGIDVAKETLAVHLITAQDEHFAFAVKNQKAAINALIKDLQRQIGEEQINKTLFCLEHTGVYANRVLYCLHTKKLAIWLEAAPRMQEVEPTIQRGKNDPVDAKRIALFAQRFVDKARMYKPRRAVINQLQYLFRKRQAWLQVQTNLQVRQQEILAFDEAKELKEFKNIGNTAINAIKRVIKKIELKMQELITKDERLKRMYKLVQSVPGIGPITAYLLLFTTNEFIKFTNPRAYATHAGVVPFERQSGKNRKPMRVSHKADKRIKTHLQMAALAAVKHNEELRAYYERKTAEGKPKMLVLNAVRNKLIHRVFAVIRKDQVYNYSLN